jgi:hypothetical protein
MMTLNPPSLARAMARSLIDLSRSAIVMGMKKEWLELHTPALTHSEDLHFYFYDSICSGDGFGLPATKG